MKTLGILAAGLLMPIMAAADTITSLGALVGIPQNFVSTIGQGGNQGKPFWNNNSNEGTYTSTYTNAGDFLTGSNPSMGTTDYLGTGFGDYLSTGGPGPDAANFTFLQSGSSVQATLLYSNSSANYSWVNYGMTGTQIGLYNVANPNQTVTVFASGTLYNPADPNGVYNNDVSPQSPVAVSTWANYGIYASSCGFNFYGNTYCDTFYSNSALNQAVDPNHEHFALFEDPTNPATFYIAYEDNLGISNYEHYGDFNDVIFKLQTTQTQNISVTNDIPDTDVTPIPEPATFSALGLGLIALGLLRRRAVRP